MSSPQPCRHGPRAVAPRPVRAPSISRYRAVSWPCRRAGLTEGIEILSSELAHRFAERCFTPLELTHYKDVFRTLADEKDGLQYWREETLCKFLAVPDALEAGPVLFQMATYLGAFPFPSLAPAILTREALVKVVVIMTERYGKVLKKGIKDRNKLLFRSLGTLRPFFFLER